MRAWLLAIVVGAAGCSSVAKCKDQTLFVSITLDATSMNASPLEVAVSVDSGTPILTTLAHTPGQSMGGVEIDFPGGYPAGHQVSVAVTALSGGTPIGSGNGAVTLGAGCSALAISVTSAAPPQDLAGADLAGADLTSMQLDFAVGPVDLNNCVPTTENCFNHVDDDCDGLVDCADPDCVGGAPPVAACVPDPGAFTVGTTAASCPAAWPTSTVIGTALSATCGTGVGCGSCSATSSFGPPDDCYALFEDNQTSSSCSGSLGYQVRATGSGVCRSVGPVASGNYHSISAPYYDGGCISSTPSTMISKNTPTWTTNDHFCSGGTIGSGCAAGTMCVPAAPKHCVMTAGSQVACPLNYVLDTTRYYTNFDDSGRTCYCGCTTTGTGSCSGSASMVIYTSSACSGGIGMPAGCSNSDISAYTYATGSGVSVASRISCSVGSTTSGMPVPTGEQTICCTP